ncbi:stress response protein SCP2 [Acinetobacter calcoaceticus]|uniref:Stress response protein SCP2 n=1 Tax=Acinetobacter calcoaceticus TaxID=471 RepID=A0A4R1XT81_ACICA|nr:stress response protein SCP2 [Acinetobacter calcoaceticus]
MAITLEKGQGLSLEKSQYDLSSVTIGMGWDIAEQKKGFLGGLFSAKSAEYDLDVVAFLCDAQGKVKNLGWDERGQVTLMNSDIVFYNNLAHPSGQIWLTGDNRDGAGDGDDEQIIVKLNTLPNEYHRILFFVQIYNGRQNKQHFGQVKNAFIRAVDATGKEILRFNLSGIGTYDQQRSMLFGELVREGGSWKFNAICTPSESDNFVEWLKDYVA